MKDAYSMAMHNTDFAPPHRGELASEICRRGQANIPEIIDRYIAPVFSPECNTMMGQITP
jgi:hypothetical protein